MPIPRQIKHATIAIMDKINPPPMDSDFEKSKFINGFNIALSKSQQYGYTTVDSNALLLEDKIKLTAKGYYKEVEHAKDVTLRSVRFDQLYDLYKGNLG